MMKKIKEEATGGIERREWVILVVCTSNGTKKGVFQNASRIWRANLILFATTAASWRETLKLLSLTPRICKSLERYQSPYFVIVNVPLAFVFLTSARLGVRSQASLICSIIP